MGDDNVSQQQKLVEKQSQARTKMAMNHLILVSILNAMTFLSFIFAMAFYEWVSIDIKITLKNCDSNAGAEYNLWINLLYVKQQQKTSYETFKEASNQICCCQRKQNQCELYCQSLFSNLSFVGGLCFSIFCLAGLLQIYDFVRVFFLLCYKRGEVEKKENFRQILTIFTYMIGITLSIFSIAMIYNLSDRGKQLQFSKYTFGISFWLCMITLIIFIGIMIYQQISIRRVIKQTLIKNLLDKEIQTRNKTFKKQNKIRQLEMTDNLELVQQGLTI